MARVRATLAYALVLSIPSGTAMGSGMWLLTRNESLGLALGVAVGAFVFGLVYLGREYGSPDEELAEGP